jgi:hypothetical protein
LGWSSSNCISVLSKQFIHQQQDLIQAGQAKRFVRRAEAVFEPPEDEKDPELVSTRLFLFPIGRRTIRRWLARFPLRFCPVEPPMFESIFHEAVAAGEGEPPRLLSSLMELRGDGDSWPVLLVVAAVLVKLLVAMRIMLLMRWIRAECLLLLLIW